ncbi:hypothetical protein PHLGIDRAFT_130199 [Phlebiopsis gigantea 11061_1 CR5-6]|uniref:DUF6534 domain-containing protein n=1 Tax=Phlebiopsis gigantea (strain 11061_1 CR5-6) TaxID=745531 RepID=A0A0C3PDI5_PHLG1|nr:hypothetical protein PHLGIDRAFT_130199 [Phlebiopsis gigantea 11061_1 CR5-6]
MASPPPLPLPPPPTKADLRATLGAINLGGLACLFLSGIVAMQVYLYLSVSRKDRLRIKVIVALVWTMDMLHTIMVCIANWSYLIEHFGDVRRSDHIIWSIGATVALTAVVTWLVHCFFIHRMHVVSQGNMYLTLSLGGLASFRLIAALVSTAEMIRLQSFTLFVDQYAYVFTMGLSSAVALDILITGGLCYYLRKSKSGFSSINGIIDTLVLYTVETGLATCITTIIALVCWVTMPNNLIFLGLHFMISKLYANSLMASLNSRYTLRARSQSSSNSNHREYSLPVIFRAAARPRSPSRVGPPAHSEGTIEISVRKTVRCEVEGESAEPGVLKATYAGRSRRDVDDHSSGDVHSESGKGYFGAI